MSMDLQKQIEQLHHSFMDIRGDDHDRKAENIKSRIYLMKQLINYEDSNYVKETFAPKHTPNEEQDAKRAEMDELRSKLTSGPSKGFPKETKSLPFSKEDMEMKKADEELKRALDKAFESI